MVFVTSGLSERGLCLLPVVCRISLHTGDSSMQGGFPDTPRIIMGDNCHQSNLTFACDTPGDLEHSR